MNPLETSQETVKQTIVLVAPEAEDDIAALDPTVDLFEQLGLDSMDHLSVMTELAARTGVEIPAHEYGRLRSVQALAERLLQSAP